MYSQLLPPQWQSIYLPLWFQEDFPTLDVATAIVGNSPATAQILFKSETVKYNLMRISNCLLVPYGWDSFS